jgi:hypothetical protein
VLFDNFRLITIGSLQDEMERIAYLILSLLKGIPK